jgi:GxxExxY protein
MPATQRRTVRTEDLDPELTAVSRKVIGAAIEVHKGLGPGFDENVYTNAICGELDDEGIPYTRDHKIVVMYKDREVGEHELGLYINDRFVVEVMAEPREVDGLDRAKLRAQLRSADLELGLIINFAERRLKDGLVRVLNPDKLNDLPSYADEDHDE